MRDKDMPQAPLFTLPDQNGTPWALDSLRGKYILIYFYPRALTPGCTTQACDINTGLAELKQRGIQVLGISTDSEKTLDKFATTYGLQFPLLSDPEHRVCEAYGAWKEKKNYGKTYWGIQRCSFAISPQGDILHVWQNVKAATHYETVLRWFDSHISGKE